MAWCSTAPINTAGHSLVSNLSSEGAKRSRMLEGARETIV
ncbi:protein of unknown function [Pseudomonas sp. JV551A1]|nr:protein of unknown function [Pseudomonas sp. JV551A1]